MNTCKDCRFAGPYGELAVVPKNIPCHECHRFPPARGDRSFAQFPLVAPHNWCGEFQPKEQPKFPRAPVELAPPQPHDPDPRQ